MKSRITNLNELRAEKMRLQSRMEFSKEMISVNLNMRSLKDMAVNSLPFDTGKLISSGVTKVFFGKSKGLRGTVIGLLIPFIVPKVLKFILKSIQKRRK